MIDFRSYLVELFERPYPVSETRRIGFGMTTIEIRYHAVVDGGKNLVIDITKINQGWEINFMLDDSLELTHAGKPYRILATVVEAVKQFLKWHMETFDELPKRFDMVSKTSEGKRDAVYSAMMRRFGKEYGYKITGTEVAQLQRHRPQRLWHGYQLRSCAGQGRGGDAGLVGRQRDLFGQHDDQCRGAGVCRGQ